MTNMETIVRTATIGDAPFLAEVVTGALGPELCLGLAETASRLHLVRELFTSLAAREESQYSFRNAYVALDEKERLKGGVIAYDGALLRPLRLAFVEEARRILGWDITPEEADGWGDEADAGEIYIDSLYVAPEARRQGVARKLVNAVADRFRNAGKPLGLLVEPENRNARLVYELWGFREVGVSHFFRTPMLHMQKEY